MKILSKISIFFVLACAALLGYSLAWSSGLIEPTRTLAPTGEKPANLSVYSEPPGLDVSLDRAGIGKTPIVSMVVKSGYHVLRVRGDETEIYIGPGKDLRLSLYKGTMIEISAETREIRRPKEPDGVKTPEKPKSEPSAQKEQELHPRYWPFNPEGPIF
jgi:hypothetical protein